MTAYLAVPLLFLAVIIQTTAMPQLRVWGVFPDFPLLLVVSWGMLRGAREGAFWGLAAGLSIDLLSGAPLGAATLGLFLTGILSGRARRATPRGFILPLVGAAALATLLCDLLFLLVLAASGRRVPWLESLVHIVLPAAGLNALLSPATHLALRPVHNRLRRQEMAV